MSEKHMDTEFDTAFEATATMKNLTVENVTSIGFKDMLEILRPLVLIEIPETFADQTERRRLDYLLARITNTHSYLMFLWSYCSYERARLKPVNAAKSEDILKKKETLYELAASLKLKYEAVSRKITLALDGEGDKNMPDRRSYGDKTYTPPPTSPNSSSAPRSGGWNSVSGR